MLRELFEESLDWCPTGEKLGIRAGEYDCRYPSVSIERPG